MTDQLTQWVETVVTLPAFLPLLSLFTFLDATIPVIPSEPVLSLGASWSGSTGSPNVWHVFLFALLGASLGDNACYVVGRRFQNRVERIRPNTRSGKAITWIKRMMRNYGPATIVIARFIPYARWTLTLLLGSMRYNWFVFFVFDTIGVAVWAGMIVAVSYLGGMLFQGSPLIGVVAGVAAGMAVGYLIQKAQTRFFEWRDERRASSSA